MKEVLHPANLLYKIKNSDVDRSDSSSDSSSDSITDSSKAKTRAVGRTRVGPSLVSKTTRPI